MSTKTSRLRGGATRFTYSGVKEMMRLLQGDIPHDLKIAIAIGCERASRVLLKRSNYYVPMDTGALLESGEVLTKATALGSNVVYSKNKYVVGVGYHTKYAHMVHEITQYAHGEAYNIKYAEEISKGWQGYNKKDPQEQAKFMEAGFQDAKSRMRAVINAEIRRGLRKVKSRKGGIRLSVKQLRATKEFQGVFEGTGINVGW